MRRELLFLLLLVPVLCGSSLNITGSLEVAGSFESGQPVSDPLFASDAPYDLSPYFDDVVTVFGSDPANWPDWPTQPSGLADCNVTAGSVSSLDTCLSAGNRRVIVPAGTYATSVTLNDDNVWFDADDDAVFTAGGPNVSGNVVKVTGGQFYGGTATLANSNTDVLIDNVYVEFLDQQQNRSVVFSQALGTNATRLAVLNSTFRASRPAGLFAAGSDDTDVILANVDMWSDYVITAGQSGGPEYAWRIQNVDDLIMVDSQARVQSLDTPENDKPGLRLHYGGENHLYTNNVYQCGTPCLRPVWVDTDAGGGEVRSHVNIHLIENRFETLQNGVQDDIQIDDSAAGGATNQIYLTRNVAASPGNDVFQVGGNDPGSAILDGNSGEIISGLTVFSGGAARTGIWPNGL